MILYNTIKNVLHSLGHHSLFQLVRIAMGLEIEKATLIIGLIIIILNNSIQFAFV